MRDTQNETSSVRAPYSIAEIAQRFGVSPGLVRLEISRGRLKAGRIGRRVVVSQRAIDNWLERGADDFAH
ncbi:helix-turn-helix domain-containing protein [Candidatus Binatus sp.]|uniref:helix-turn-helix domain-containing protein n=1 Tax=Candidatus Binatus sp. TaxID=2811406 RepID=UPI003CC56993